MQFDYNKRINIITGHYGSGKTNIAVNMALDMKKQGLKVCLVDFDIVNPYFRSADMREMLVKNGIKVLASVYANTNLDIPAIPPEINTVFDDKSYTCILDVGGDDAGAAALGQFANKIKSDEYLHFYVINARRSLTQTAREAVGILRDIEKISHINADLLINNTHLCKETDKDIIEASFGFADEVSEISGLPVAFTAARRDIADKIMIPEKNNHVIFPVDIFVKMPWDDDIINY